MRRTKLIWFAMGAFIACASFLISRFVYDDGLVLDDTQVFYLVLAEPLPELTEGAPVGDADMIAYRTGDILKKCRANGFETTPDYPDQQATAELPLVAENFSALECVIKAIQDENLSFHIEPRWSSKVVNEMRSGN